MGVVSCGVCGVLSVDNERLPWHLVRLVCCDETYDVWVVCLGVIWQNGVAGWFARSTAHGCFVWRSPQCLLGVPLPSYAGSVNAYGSVRRPKKL